MIRDVAIETGTDVDEKAFQKEFEKHQTLSRTASAGRFKSGLADDSEATTKLHTATHLLLAAIKNRSQRGEFNTKRFEHNFWKTEIWFFFSKKTYKRRNKKVEDLVNAQIQKGCEVIREEMAPEQAKKKGATGVFNAKYGEIISVYTIKDCSKEICSGPHVKNTCELGHFKIKKEESKFFWC